MRERMDVWGRTYTGGWSRLEDRLLLEVTENGTTGVYTATISVLGKRGERLAEHTIFGSLEDAQTWADLAAERLVS